MLREALDVAAHRLHRTTRPSVAALEALLHGASQLEASLPREEGALLAALGAFREWQARTWQ
jgi:hypothetical protein